MNRAEIKITLSLSGISKDLASSCFLWNASAISMQRVGQVIPTVTLGQRSRGAPVTRPRRLSSLSSGVGPRGIFLKSPQQQEAGTGRPHSGSCSSEPEGPPFCGQGQALEAAPTIPSRRSLHQVRGLAFIFAPLYKFEDHLS